MGETVVLHTVTKPILPVNEDLIVGLEALLERARADEYQGIAYVMIASDGAGSYLQIGTGWRGTVDYHVTLGGVVTLQHRLLTEHLEAP